MHPRPLLLVASSLFVASCGNSSLPLVVESRSEVPIAPVIVSFTAEPSILQDGERAELRWEVSDPDAELKLAPLGETLVGNSKVVSPAVTTTYTLTASNAAGITFADVTVSVVANPTATLPPWTDLFPTDWAPAAGDLEGKESECGNLSLVAADPSSGRVIASVAQHGLWSLDAETDNWIELGQGPGSDVITNRGVSIIWDPDDPNTFWESGIYNGGGIYRTRDAGMTFEQLGDITHTEFFDVNLNDPNRGLIVTTLHEQGEVHKSTDGGESWTDLSGGIPDDAGAAESVLIIDDQTFLVGTRSASASGIFLTTDGGRTFARKASLGVAGRPVVDDAGTIYWLLEQGLGMVSSNDAGESWNLLGSGPGAPRSRSLQLLSDGSLVTIGGGSLILSSDQGESWQRLGPLLPYDADGFTYSEERNAFFAWRFDCNQGDNSILPNSIVRIDLSRPLVVGQG